MKPIELHVCPVLSFTPATEVALAMFNQTHGIQTGHGSYWYERRALPATGGVGEQSALLMQQLNVLEQVHNAVIAEDIKRRKAKGASEKRG